ncbi:MAG TPA: hypothetical protein VGD79_04880 [Thermoanaerobaculia bacterium]
MSTQLPSGLALAHDAPLHIVVSEMMQCSLAVEPFVAILENLRAQVVPGGFFVPERVTVDAVLIVRRGSRCGGAGRQRRLASPHSTSDA